MTSLDTNQGGDPLPFQMPSPGDPMAAQRMRQSVPQIDAEDDAVFAKMDAAREQQMLNTFRLAVKKDANLRAEAVRIAGEIGQTPDLVEKNIAVMREWAKRRKVAEMNMTRSNPVLAGKLLDLEFARITHDDVANLGFVENITKQFQAGAVTQKAGELEWKKAQKTATAQEEAQLESLRTAQEDLPMTSGGFFGGAARSLGQMGVVSESAIKTGIALGVTSATMTSIATSAGIATLPAAVATVPASFITGFGIGFTSEAFVRWQTSMSGSAFRQMVDEGYDEDAAYYASFGVGIIGSALETASMGTATSFLVKPLAKRLISDTIAKRLTKEGVSEAFTQLTTRSALKTGLTRYAQTLGAEGLTEASQTVVEHLGRKIAKQYSPDVLLREFADPSKADDLSDSLASMFEETLYQAGLLSAVAPGLALRVDLAKAKRADAAFQTLGNLVKAVDATATKKRNPDVAADTVQDMADASGAGTFYVAPDKLGEVLNALGETPESADKVIPGLAARLTAALQSGGLVEIPAGDFVARTARTGFQEAILPHIKTAVDAMSQFEAKEVISQFQQNIAAHGEMAMQDKDFAESAARVGKSIYEQVKGSGVFDADDKVRGATLAAKTWFQNFAARVNQSPEEAQALFGKTRITPEDVYAKFPLKIGVGEMNVTGVGLNAIGESGPNIQPLFDLSYVSEGNAIRTVKVGDTTIVLDARSGSIKVSSVRTTKAKRGTGSARAAMSALVAQADAQNVTLTLDASPLDNATSRSGLVKFYESLGFDATGEVINQAGDPQMSRSPSTLKAGSTAQYSVGEHKITLTKSAKLPEFMHELSHFWTDVTLALAQDPNAPAFAKQDAQTLLDFFGLKSMDEWNALSKPERVKRYEQIAYNAPIYWAEGKAPTKGLAKLFNNMRRWILDVYKDIRGSMNEQYRKEIAKQGLPLEDLPILTPEIRRWFDNMLASERMIEEAYAARKLQPMFEAKPDGMSDAQWSELQEVSQSQFEKALNTLDQHSLATVGYYKRKADEIRSKIDRQKQEVRKALREETAREVRSRPVYQAINYLLTGKILYTDGTQKESKRVRVIANQKGEGKIVTGVHKLQIDAIESMVGFGQNVGELEQQQIPKSVESAIEARDKAVEDLVSAKKNLDEIEKSQTDEDAQFKKDIAAINEKEKGAKKPVPPRLKEPDDIDAKIKEWGSSGTKKATPEDVKKHQKLLPKGYKLEALKESETDYPLMIGRNEFDQSLRLFKQPETFQLVESRKKKEFRDAETEAYNKQRRSKQFNREHYNVKRENAIDDNKRVVEEARKERNTVKTLYSTFKESRAASMQDLKARIPALQSRIKDLSARIDLGMPKVATQVLDKLEGMVATVGLDPREVAESFGFKDAATMIRQIIASPSIEEKIEEVTDRRIEAEFSELSDPQKVEETIASAIHNDLRADMIAMEFRALSKMMMPLGVLRDAARIAAITILNGMNVGDIDVRKFDAAAVRARRMAEKAMGKPNGTFEALQYKRQELLQTELARLATQEKKEIEKRIASIKKMGKVGDKDLGKGRHYETALAARALAGLYEIAGSAKFVDAKAKIENIKTYDEEMHRELAEILAVAANVVEEARARRNVIGGKLTRSQKQVYKSITLDEFKNATDAIEAIWQEASDMKKVEIDGKQMLVDEAAPLLEQKLVDRGAPEVADNVNARRTEARKRMGMFMGHRAHVTRLENLFLYLDGGTPGPWTKMVWRPLNDASVAYRKQWAEFNAEFNAIFKAIRDTGQKDIDAPRLKYKFADKWELLHAILYSGSVTGKDKLLRAGTSDRTPWGAVRDDGTLDDSAWQETINELVLNGTLTAADFKAVEKLFALFAKLQKPYFQAWRKVFGHPPEAIEHLDIVTPIGTFKGGYIPLRADPERNVDAKFRDLNQETLKTHRVALARVKSGAGKKRTGAVYPLLMDLRKIPSVLGEQIRFINIQPKLGEVMKLLKHQNVMGALERYDETLFTDAIDKWLQRIAFQSTSTPSSYPGIDKWARQIKQSVGLTRMVGNYGNIIGQSTGLAVAVPEVGADRMAKALHHVMTNFGDVFGKIAEADEGMRQRFENQMFDISADTRAVFEDPNWMTKLQDLAATKGYKPQAFVQNIIDATVWMAAYDKAMSDPSVAAMSEEDADAEAVARAGSTVRRTQGALNPESISAYEAGTALHQWFTQFQNYFVMLLNNGYWKGKGDIEQYGWKVGGAKAAYMYLWSMMIPFAVGTAIISFVKGTLFDDDDEDGYSDIWFDALVAAPLTGTAGTIPYAGPLMVGVINRLNDKPYDDRIGSAPSIFALERAATFAGKTITGKTFTDPSGKTISDAATFFSIWFKIPLDAVAKPFIYWTDVATDRVEPTGPWDAIRGTITGAASKDSKQ
jgi:hypothetical protein